MQFVECRIPVEKELGRGKEGVVVETGRVKRSPGLVQCCTTPLPSFPVGRSGIEEEGEGEKGPRRRRNRPDPPLLLYVFTVYIERALISLDTLVQYNVDDSAPCRKKEIALFPFARTVPYV